MLGTNTMMACALNFHVVTLTFDGMLLGQVAVSEGIHDANGKLFLHNPSSSESVLKLRRFVLLNDGATAHIQLHSIVGLLL